MSHSITSLYQVLVAKMLYKVNIHAEAHKADLKKYAAGLTCHEIESVQSRIIAYQMITCLFEHSTIHA